MSLLFKRGTRAGEGVSSLIPRRLSTMRATQKIDRDASLKSSVKWACLRVRGDLVSTTPVDVFRKSGQVMLEVARPPVLDSPDGERDLTEWLYSSQFDLDDCGNTFGVITQRDRLGYPAQIHLVPADRVVVKVTKGQVSYWVDGSQVPNDEIWHERQFTTSGHPMGLSPTAYAALALSGTLSASEFAAQWFAGAAIPAAQMRNSEKVVPDQVADKLKARWDETMVNGGLLVTGKDWEYSILGAKASEAMFIDMIKGGAPDVCRYYGVPGDIVDVEISTKSITYATITQRNLQLLIINLGPAFTRREKTFSRLLVPRGQVVKFATDAVLRMDPTARGELMDKAIDSRRMTVTEARGLDNRPPLTPEQEAEFARLFPVRNQTIPETGAPS